jgi:hypothetical protein
MRVVRLLFCALPAHDSYAEVHPTEIQVHISTSAPEEEYPYITKVCLSGRPVIVMCSSLSFSARSQGSRPLHASSRAVQSVGPAEQAQCASLQWRGEALSSVQVVVGPIHHSSSCDSDAWDHACTPHASTVVVLLVLDRVGPQAPAQPLLG